MLGLHHFLPVLWYKQGQVTKSVLSAAQLQQQQLISTSFDAQELSGHGLWQSGI